jgi:hypothetical protein
VYVKAAVMQEDAITGIGGTAGCREHAAGRKNLTQHGWIS